MSLSRISLHLRILGRRLAFKLAGWNCQERTAAYWGTLHSRGTDAVYWLEDTEIAHWVNTKISGEATIWPLSWFLLNLPAALMPVERAFSMGCGAGSLEREVIRHGSARIVHGVDLSATSLKIAVRKAEEAGVSNSIRYHKNELSKWLKNEAGRTTYDLGFFHASLHHLSNLEEVLALAALCLRSGRPGLLYVDEYIGPSRTEWTEEHLRPAAPFFRRIPKEHRRTKRLNPPIALADPSEMIRSSAIVSAVKAYFEVVHYKPYYGNVLMPLVAALKRSSLETPLIREILRDAMKAEQGLIEGGDLQPLYAVLVGKPA